MRVYELERKGTPAVLKKSLDIRRQRVCWNILQKRTEGATFEQIASSINKSIGTVSSLLGDFYNSNGFDDGFMAIAHGFRQGWLR